MGLTKSLYLRGRRCLKALWLDAHRPGLAAPPSAALLHALEEGQKIGELARTLFPGGTLVEPGGIEAAARRTRDLIARGADTLYEAAFAREDVAVRADILVKTEAGWRLIEVKSSTELKDVYLEDLAVQTWVLQAAGLPLEDAALMHVDRDYVRRGPVDPGRLFKVVEASGLAAPCLALLPSHLRDMRRALASGEPPDVPIGAQCRAPYDCKFMGHCWRHVPPYSVYNLKRASFEKIDALRERGVMRLEDIPDDVSLTPAQARQVRVAKTGETIVKREALRKHLSGLRHPLHYLDFETVSLALPPYDGLRPFQPLPFQASLHVERTPEAPLEHSEFLAEPGRDPRPDLVRFLCRRIGPEGSLVVYNASFEGGRLEELAEAFPENAAALASMKARLWDLIVPFRSGHFLHPLMKGSASMKAVLPALVPGLGYGDLAIANGEAAYLAYEDLMAGRIPADRIGKTMADLRAYCGRDTLGMVEVLKALRRALEAAR